MPSDQEKGIDTQKAGRPEVGPTGANHLLVIAIDDYVHCPKLNNCVKDAQDLIEVLDTRYGISIDNKILPPLFNAEATKKNIVYSFRQLAEKVRPQDSVLIYFSGHGEYDKVLKQGYWVPVEATKGGIDTYLPNSEVRVYLDAINSHHTFMMVDSCFSGTLFVDKSVDKNIERYERDPSRWGLTSGRNEIVSDGEAGKNSPFAESLLYRLRQNTGNLGVMHLCDFVLEQVKANAIQSPRGEPLRVEGHKGGQFYFKPKNLQPPSIGSFKKVEEVEQFISTKPEEPKLEQAWWKRALLMDSSKGYDDYLDHYPGGKFKTEALSGLALKEEDELWQECKIENTKAAYQKYRTTYPNGRYAADALRLKSGLEVKPTSTPPSVKEAEPEVPVEKRPPSKEKPKSDPRPMQIPVPENMVHIPGGTFQMGDVMGDKEYDNETVHTVTLSDFLICKNVVTFDEYDAFCTATKREKPSDSGWGRGKRPVINVSWEDAVAYCGWRSKMEGLTQVYAISGNRVSANWQANGYRLPTEAEWEYAARAGGKKVRFGNGKDIADPKEINFDGSASYKKAYSVAGEYRSKTLPVGSFAPNALGLYDMSGNVWEWCWDWYGSYPTSSQTNPKGPNTGSNRVVRGGSWIDDPQNCRVAYRFVLTPGYRNLDIGFRLSRTL